MADVWVVLVTLGFFALCWLFVLGCDRIIGPDDESELSMEPDELEPIADEVVA